MPFSIGEYIGPYQLVEEIDQGGMANVYKAYHSSLDRYVAIKAIQTVYAQDEDFLMRFQREARVIAKLEHPNIVPIYDFSQVEGRPYIVMKLIDGESLRDRLNRTKLNDLEILAILESVGSALSYAHQHNVLHRDIKPGNVLIGRDGHIFLADFGLARLAFNGGASITGDRMIGTPHYMSPEQGLGLAKLDQRTDIYSLGVMLYEMVAGRVPFDAETPFTIIHDHIYTPPPPPHTFNKNITPQVESILEKALAKDPNDRYPDADTLVSQYRFYIQNISKPDGSISKSNPFNRQETGTLPGSSGNHPLNPQYLSNDQKTSNRTDQGTYFPGFEKTSESKKNGVKKHKWSIILTVCVFSFLLLAIISGGIALFMTLQPGLNSPSLISQQDQVQTTIAEQVKTMQMTASLQANRTPLVTPSGGLSVVPNSNQVIQMINEAGELWNNGKTQEAQEKISEAQKISGMNAAFYELAVKELSQQNAWGLAAYTLYSGERTQPVENVFKQVDKIHEVIYKAAGDKRSESLFIQYGSNPIFSVASIRYELYFGDHNQAKQKLDKSIGNPVQNKRFPEMKLLLIEYDLVIKDNASAKIHLKNLLQDKANLPIWVKEEALKLEPVINPP